MILHGDCLEILPMLDENSFDSCVTDPPYGLSKEPDMAEVLRHWLAGDDYEHHSKGFMGKTWDSFVPGPAVWREVYRVLKPGGHVLAFFGTRTYDMGVVAMRLAGFEIRDQVQWLYGCLDSETQAVTPNGPVPHTALSAGDTVLAYDPSRKSYQWETVDEVLRYEIDDTVYRISTDFGDQIVSRNHRCIIERSGVEVFEFAEDAAQELEACVPVLEDLPALLEAVRGAQSSAGGAEPHLFSGVQSGDHRCESYAARRRKAGVGACREVEDGLRGLREYSVAEHEAHPSRSQPGVFAQVQRGFSSEGAAVVHRPARTQPGSDGRVGEKNDRAVEPFVERRSDVPEEERELRKREVRALPSRVLGDVAQGRVRDGAPIDGSEGDRPPADAAGVCTPHRPLHVKQCADESDVVCNKQRPQTVRAWRGHKTVVGRITPERYRGVIWCVRVKSGAFVAVRNGFAFPTGNSGFPKSHDVSKAIDKMAGAEREVLSEGAPVKRMIPGADQSKTGSWIKDNGRVFVPTVTAPATAEAAQWEGWGTALKPAHEPIVVARKPLIGTVAENVLAYGVGGLNIDGCRVGGEPTLRTRTDGDFGILNDDGWVPTPGANGSAAGRWPANVIHDGSDEVLAAFPNAPGQQGDLKPTGRARPSSGRFGDMAPPHAHPARVEFDKSAARFFYCAKSSKSDRNDGLDDFAAKPSAASEFRPNHTEKAEQGEDGNPYGRWKPLKNNHPTVKPTDLMRWLCRLVTPPGGKVLDPFAGSGSTGRGAVLEGFQFTGIEMSEEYVEIARARIAAARKRYEDEVYL